MQWRQNFFSMEYRFLYHASIRRIIYLYFFVTFAFIDRTN